jgi:hypothetical protein
MASAESLRQQTDALSPYGGFGLIESVIEGAGSLNPAYPARNNIFLADGRKRPEREALLETLTIWADVLERESSAEMVDYCDQQSDHL